MQNKTFQSCLSWLVINRLQHNTMLGEKSIVIYYLFTPSFNSSGPAVYHQA